MSKYTRDSSKRKLIALLAFAAAAVLVIVITANSRNNFLKANEEGEGEVVTEAADVQLVEEVVAEPVAEESAPVEEAAVSEEKISTSEIEESESVTPTDPENSPEPATESESDTEDSFDVVKAYEYYITLDDQQKAMYLTSLSDGNREALLSYIQLMSSETPKETEPIAEEKHVEIETQSEEPEEAEAQTEGTEADEEKVTEQKTETPKSVSIWYDNLTGDDVTVGSVIRFNSSLTGFDGIDGITYQWMRSKDGLNWEPVPGATSDTMTLTVDESNWQYTYKLSVSTPD